MINLRKRNTPVEKLVPLKSKKHKQQVDVPVSGGTATVEITSHKDVMVVALVAFKGGCAKTTTAVEISHTLRQHFGLSVMLVDMDAQRHSSCNFLQDEGKIVKNEAKEKENDESNESKESKESKEDESKESKDDDVCDISMSQILNSSSHGEVPIMDGPINATETRYETEFSAFTEVESRSIYEILKPGILDSPPTTTDSLPKPMDLGLPESGPGLKGPKSKYGKLYLIPGDFRMKKIEEELMRSTTETRIRTWGWFNWIVRELAVERKCQFVVIDTPPADSYTNAMIAKSADALIPPAFPDNNSLHSIRDLLIRVIPGWIELWEERIHQQSTPREADIRQRYPHLLMNTSMPAILPIVINNYDQGPLIRKKGVPVQRQLDALSTAFTERINMVVASKEPDADGNPRVLPSVVRSMMYPWGPSNNPQMVVRLVPHVGELVRWAQLRGQSMYTWANLEKDAEGKFVKKQLIEYCSRLLIFYNIWHENQ